MAAIYLLSQGQGLSLIVFRQTLSTCHLGAVLLPQMTFHFSKGKGEYLLHFYKGK